MSLYVWKAASGKLERTQPSDGLPILFSPDGSLLVSGSAGKAPGNLRFWEPRTGKRLRSFSEACVSAAFSPDSRMLASLDALRGVVTLRDAATGRPVHTLAVGTMAQGPRTYLAFSPDGSRLTVVGMQPWTHGRPQAVEEITHWDAATGRRRGAPIRFPQRLPWSPLSTDFALSPDGRTLAYGSRTRIQLWDTATGALEATLDSRGEASPRSLFFSPDSDLQRWLRPLVGRREGGLDNVRCLAFSPDGNTLAVGTSDKVKLWDVRRWIAPPR